MTKIKIEIKNRFTGKILFEYEKENNTIRDTVLEAIKSWADLSEADLSWADLSEADLSWANLSWANLSKANLSEANLSWADLSEANLSWADLSWANLSVIKHDFWAILLPSQKEIPGLRLALIEGKIDGSTYEGECCCLVGTIANVAHCRYDALPVVKPNSSRPAERFFLGIRKGDTPENNACAKAVLEWIDEFLLYTKSS